MSSHGRRFQVGIGMVELQGMHNPNIKVSLVPVKYTVKELILPQKKSEGKKIFFL